MRKTYYELLNLKFNSTKEEISKSFIKIIKEANLNDEITRGGLSRLILAYEVLSNPNEREKYNLTLTSEDKKRIERNYILYTDAENKYKELKKSFKQTMDMYYNNDLTDNEPYIKELYNEEAENIQMLDFLTTQDNSFNGYMIDEEEIIKKDTEVKQKKPKLIDVGLKLVKPELSDEWIMWADRYSNESYSVRMVEATISYIKYFSPDISFNEINLIADEHQLTNDLMQGALSATFYFDPRGQEHKSHLREIKRNYKQGDDSYTKK